jgi:hypothetical protein
LRNLFVEASFFSGMGGKSAIDNTQYFSRKLRITGKQKPKLKKEAQYSILIASLPHCLIASLPNWLIGQHIINQQGSAFCHSPSTVTWAGCQRLKPSA